jgi:hypothetical protein
VIVSFIVGSSHSGVDGVFFVDGKEEDQLPCAPERNGNNGKDNSSEQISSSTSVVSSEEVNHLTCGNSKWDQKEEGNENEPPWEVFIQKLEECNCEQDNSENEDLDSNEHDTASDWEATEASGISYSIVRAGTQAAAAWA